MSNNIAAATDENPTVAEERTGPECRLASNIDPQFIVSEKRSRKQTEHFSNLKEGNWWSSSPRKKARKPVNDSNGARTTHNKEFYFIKVPCKAKYCITLPPDIKASNVLNVRLPPPFHEKGVQVTCPSKLPPGNNSEREVMVVVLKDGKS
mmetsp:Transcript_6199/g.9058  ORF Transcript_6199/g.9058 Transcript_6199/m.9058 type:complete len:150 (-) Transcript_6199:224-673(-)|eukprot:CAMPEP_0172419086 /NCGR_PEP_ID=MMETSP1064-20121228/5528_1 /TAXON_ID=202472 /ORGANISM="Aulacoseira subarctica , Strain CCAP 1002/5" /LENGTH=149 /DNA_ID=CAMNT_0013158363 /DNA_START=167 /DNA_END=616 /DNA_ORIENTATION=-